MNDKEVKKAGISPVWIPVIVELIRWLKDVFKKKSKKEVK